MPARLPKPSATHRDGALLAVSAAGAPALAVRTQRVAYSSFTVKLPENGVVMHPGTLTVPTLVAGNIGQIFVKAGEHVTAGELLATIDNPTIESNASGPQDDYNSAFADGSSARANERKANV